MKDHKTREVDVKLEDGETVKIKVTRPSNTIITDAQRISAKVWTDCVRDGIMTKKELSKFMRKQKIWDKEQEEEENKLKEDILKLEKSLYLGNGKKPVPIEQGKNTAIDIRKKRNELRELIGERLSLESNTAEALADNARFDYLVTRCTTYEDGNLVYSSVEDYSSNSDSEIAFSAATTLAEMMYSLEDDFEKKLPENKFLLEFDLVNKDLSLVNKDGETVDLEGRKINELGQYVNEDGQRTDAEGNRLEEDGTYVLSTNYVDSDGKPVVEKKPAPKKKTTTKKTKAVSTESKEG